MSSLYLPPVLATEEPDWDTFRGNNHRWIKDCGRGSGFLSFTQHIGKPLSPALWKLLVFVLGVQRLRVLEPFDLETTEPRVGVSASVYLNENNCVRDVHVFL